MSLNWKEIDLALDELALPGSFVQQVMQPDFRNLYLEVFRPGARCYLRICLETGATRLHRTSVVPARPRVRQRFAQFLHATIKGAHITAARQVGGDRIVRIDLERGDERAILWARLWGGASNIIVTDPAGRILDAFYRRPSRGEITEGTYSPTEPERAAERQERFTPRWTVDVNRSIDEHYAAREQGAERTSLIDRTARMLAGREARLRDRLAELQERSQRDPDREQTIGDLLMANLHRIEPMAKWADVEDYTRDNELTRIELDPMVTPRENAERFYQSARRARRRTASLEEERTQIERRLAEVRADLERYDSLSSDELHELLGRGQGGSVPGERTTPGLTFHSHGFTLLVGRNARESDELLRRHAKGNDLWLHTRDHPGGFVFVRSRGGKSVPLEVLLDAGNLAVYFSKARAGGRADLYYTQVKHLRRAKDGKRGLVLPTQEKNLAIDLDAARLARLLGRPDDAGARIPG